MEVPHCVAEALTRSSAAGNPPTVGSSAGHPGYPDALRINLRPAHQQIDAANAIQHFDAARRVSTAIAVETSLALVFRVMLTLYFSALNCLDQQANETQFRKSPRVGLVKEPSGSLRGRKCRGWREPCRSSRPAHKGWRQHTVWAGFRSRASRCGTVDG